MFDIRMAFKFSMLLTSVISSLKAKKVDIARECDWNVWLYEIVVVVKWYRVFIVKHIFNHLLIHHLQPKRYSVH